MQEVYQNEKRMSMLKKRVKRCVCKSCGRPLSLRQIDFNDFDESRTEIYCENCDRLEFGIEPEIYASAAYYVDEFDVNLYPDMGKNAVTRKMSIAKISTIMSWCVENLGYLNKDGFTVPPDTDHKLLGECVTLDDNTIESMTKDVISHDADGN